MQSILSEVQQLSDQQTREVVLLGQNVNGYHDTSADSAQLFPVSQYQAAVGFSNLYNSRRRALPGARFSDLLAAVADVDTEMRVRFTSPHPKDFNGDVFKVVGDYSCACCCCWLTARFFARFDLNCCHETKD